MPTWDAKALPKVRGGATQCPRQSAHSSRSPLMKTSLTPIAVATLAVVAALSLSACHKREPAAGSTGPTSSSTTTIPASPSPGPGTDNTAGSTGTPGSASSMGGPGTGSTSGGGAFVVGPGTRSIDS